MWLDAAELAKQYPFGPPQNSCLNKMPPGQYEADEEGYEAPDATDDYSPRSKIGSAKFNESWAGRPFFKSRESAENKMIHWLESERPDIVEFVKKNAYGYAMEQAAYDRLKDKRRQTTGTSTESRT